MPAGLCLAAAFIALDHVAPGSTVKEGRDYSVECSLEANWSIAPYSGPLFTFELDSWRTGEGRCC